ncbi:MAG: glucosamine 6-phosphate synthetase, contains amidotransferase and phosphosugar isomerase domain [Acidimicrobiales bacterium]|nr:glucosamine 6-phosphate synthetase, contains amidotransferase and phosphosugar isomerase domain [Acidimicrobiales bacterium]
MCGIIAVLSRPATRAAPEPTWLTERVATAAGRVPAPGSPELHARLAEAAELLEEADAALRGVPGVRTLVEHPGTVEALRAGVARVDQVVAALERWADSGTCPLAGPDLEAFNEGLIRVKDASWAVGRDRLTTAEAVADLAGPGAAPAALSAFHSVQIALSSIDRLEVRGRDSAGLHILVRGHGLDMASMPVGGRLDDPLFTSMAMRTPDGHLAFVYKAAAEIGELGDNTRALRAAIRDDQLLHLALASETARVSVLGHTRWASVGIISEANAHPVNHEEEGRASGPYVTAALNGDVDNFAELKERWRLEIPAAITTDAKVIPVLVSRQVGDGLATDDAFRRTVAAFGGSVAIAAQTAGHPNELLLALRGSGQALCVGLAEDAYVVASEPYGLVEVTPIYLRMDGEVPSPTGERGQVVVLDGDGAGTLAGIRRLSYDGTELPVTDAELSRAAITTRDIDRGPFPHFLLKELTEAPRSFRKTLRGRIEERDGLLHAALGPDAVPPSLTEGLRAGRIRRVLVVGQGTAAVAGQAVAAFLTAALQNAPVTVTALPATELSGFELDDDMSDSAVVAVSQSGTTTDTNRTVDMVRSRGATVVCIVNRRNSDLVEKSDGVIYTSDGRDVEMSVPSTKAFYAQVAAGALLALRLAEDCGGDPAWVSTMLEGLQRLPTAMEAVLMKRDELAEAAQLHAPTRRHWAVVGNGPNRVAAAEVRIKLSELCYKSIACDTTEDKKHIDLSAEPLIFVCAAGVTGANAEDVAKELAIYRAHKAAPVVVATDGEEYPAALATVTVPSAPAELAFVLSAMAGHLFGYEAALAIDGQARPLREARAALEAAAFAEPDAEAALDRLAGELQPIAARFLDDLRAGSYDGSLEASTASRLASLLRYATGVMPLDAYQLDYGKVGTPSVILEDLTDALTRGIEELTRPIDAIKHQAKTVTVGISRSEDALLAAPLVRELLQAGAGRDRLSYRALRTLAALNPAVDEVVGYTRYRIDGSAAEGQATIAVIDKGGVAAGIPSRAEQDPRLRGTKRQVARNKEVTVARGRADGRTFILVPETKDNQTTELTLLHVRFHDRLAPDVAANVLQGYRGRYAILRDAVTETEPTFREDLLGDIPVVDLLEQPIHVLADRWRTPEAGGR